MRKPNARTARLSTHLSKRNELRNRLRAFLSHPGAGINDLRGMVGMGAKFILPKKSWDHSGEVDDLRRLGIGLHTHPIVIAIFDGFRRISTVEMMGVEDPVPILKQMCRYDRVLQGNPSRKVRKKRLTRYRREMIHILLTLRALAGLPSNATAGVRYSMECIGRHFLS